ncbi:mycofactocin-coupled SDR family oxidoreductase [[Mycobacterium] vasticus]|uniref:Mycofactocin-coupled SDR family oxidoreductase n=1 Tax=[Mycobacterium] vasticus TaxID=2875777 RepID=A0ABU5YZE1_9MYCO|nr:mycofactocin-coupled SDR family oxidoreductase [Mycolicibacter sp. MYC017]MEB3069719.1 mycofactocin-coupled SDR family oxidoreductase [Mycolicibacter sp. MYC017]
MSGRVAGKRVLLTGAARGMGRSHAVRLAEEGADLILVDICASLPDIEYRLSTPEELEETARLVAEHGRRAVTHVVDVRDAAALAAAVDDGVAQLGGLDASVANAGVLTAGTWDTTTSEQWRTVIDVNLIGTWNTCSAALPHLVERGGSLINISSVAGLKGIPLHTPYTASKHGVVGMSRALANELASVNVRVNTVHPTGVETGMRPDKLMNLLQRSEHMGLGPIFMNALPIVMTEARDVSNAVLFLVSDESRHVTGLEFKVDAGATLR